MILDACLVVFTLSISMFLEYLQSPRIWAALVLWWLACLDLMVWVVNDAVNFLNSAFGSRVASRRVILLIAWAGLFVGAAFSSGMMEIARNGIFNPAVLSYYDIMMLFFAVIIADILLLDIYNSLWLQTSTTVSVIFELLWAWLGIGVIYLFSTNLPVGDIAQYINATSTIRIISWIFLSILISFSAWRLIQSILRLIFTFEYERVMQRFWWLFGAISIAAIAYFLIIKGMKGMSFVPVEWISWVWANTFYSISWLIVLFSWLLFSWQRFFNANILRITVFVGTFAIAAAFASNDLVNFIWVSIAGFQSTVLYLSQSLPAGEFMMTAMKGKIATPWFLLFFAAWIMLLSLLYSKKAIRITETELGMTTHKLWDEKFVPWTISRSLLSWSIALHNYIQWLIPINVRSYIQQRFLAHQHNFDQAQQDYDLLRASVNLTLAAVLISIATAMKLPLSTTYVTFMIAMGTALADGARGRDSAVYRISGMLTVIVWRLMTWLLALLTSFLIVIILRHTWFWWVSFGVLFTAYFLYRSHRSKIVSQKEITYDVDRWLKDILLQQTQEIIKQLWVIYAQIISALSAYDASMMKEWVEQATELANQTKHSKKHIHYLFQSREHELVDLGYHYSSGLERLRKLSLALSEIAIQSSEYLLNKYPQLHEQQHNELHDLSFRVLHLLAIAWEIISNDDFWKVELFYADCLEFDAHLNILKTAQLRRIKQHIVWVRNTSLYLHILSETDAIVANLQKLIKRIAMMQSV